MKLISLCLLITLTLSSNANEQKLEGKWIPNSRYVLIPEHQVALKVVQERFKSYPNYSRKDYIYHISESSDNDLLIVFVDYIVEYTEEGEPLFNVGGHSSYYVNAKGEIVEHHGGL